ncbi:MAG TPA: hypothetical protein VN026_11605, partial [Bacteroidia bacterium]|nr:hypothetical protein [Bacteroidia bacterium]
MKNIYKIALFLVLLLSVNKTNAQNAPMTCLTPSLGVFDGNTFSPISATIPCTYSNVINISPSQFAVGNAGTTPCIRIIVNPTNANAASNNSIAIGEGSNTNIISLCNSFPAPCFTFVPSSTNYTFSLFFMDPSQGHGYNLCNTNIAGNMNYTIASCYNSTPITTGVWNNAIAGGCQTVTIPANTPIGTVGYSISPAIVPTASLNSNNGDLWLDTYQMPQGVYTITYSFNSQGTPSCGITVTRTISITNPYSATWSPPAAMCANGACVNLVPQITGSAGGTFTAPAGVSSNSFCPALTGAGTFPVTYTVGITPTCGSSQNQNITVNPLPVANAGPTQSL